MEFDRAGVKMEAVVEYFRNPKRLATEPLFKICKEFEKKHAADEKPKKSAAEKHAENLRRQKEKYGE